MSHTEQTAVDLIIAAGASHGPGAALMRLQAEYDAQATATRPQSWHICLQALTDWCQHARIADHSRAASAVLAWWLQNTCQTCDGLGKTIITDSPVLSATDCSACRGTGHTRLPHGQDGRKIEAYINDCVQSAQHGMRKKLC